MSELPNSIPVFDGAEALVDSGDYDRMMKYKWHLSSKGYAIRSVPGKSSGITMHRMIMDPPKGVMVDHINGQVLDNRRSNLRIVNALQNAQNRKKNVRSRSMYKGVSWKVANGKWQARIRVENKQFHIGLYDTELEAAVAYNNAAKLQHGVYSRLNVLPEGYTSAPPSGDCPMCHQSLIKRELVDRTYPELLTEDEKQALLQKSVDLWNALEENKLGGFSSINRPYFIMHEFKEIIEKYGKRDVGLTWQSIDLQKARKNNTDIEVQPLEDK